MEADCRRGRRFEPSKGDAELEACVRICSCCLCAAHIADAVSPRGGPLVHVRALIHGPPALACIAFSSPLCPFSHCTEAAGLRIPAARNHNARRMHSPAVVPVRPSTDSDLHTHRRRPALWRCTGQTWRCAVVCTGSAL